jgi:hypothetical protein
MLVQYTDGVNETDPLDGAVVNGSGLVAHGPGGWPAVLAGLRGSSARSGRWPMGDDETLLVARIRADSAATSNLETAPPRGRPQFASGDRRAPPTPRLARGCGVQASTRASSVLVSLYEACSNIVNTDTPRCLQGSLTCSPFGPGPTRITP